MLNLTYLKIFAIDPENCTDADDAFSIIFEETRVVLWLFIADPTKEFTFTEFLNNNYIEKATTKYFFNKSPDHLFSDDIVKKYSLNIGIKPAIGIKVIFDKKFNIKSHEIHFVEINIDKHYSYTNVKICKVISKGVQLLPSFYTIFTINKK